MDANGLVFMFLKSSRVCMTKKRVASKMLFSKTKTSLALRYLRKVKKVAIFRSNNKVYWGVV